MGELYIHNLEKYITEYNLNTFIETGTGIGTGVMFAKNFKFSKIFSIEIIEELFNRSKKLEAFDDRIKLINDSSINGLIKILPTLSEADKVLFWLDAHFPGADFKFNTYDHLSDIPSLHMPLEDEIKIIHQYRHSLKDVFIIDDLRIYEDGNYELGKWDLKDKYGKQNINFILDLYKDTHNVHRDYRHQGFLILTPK